MSGIGPTIRTILITPIAPMSETGPTIPTGQPSSLPLGRSPSGVSPRAAVIGPRRSRGRASPVGVTAARPRRRPTVVAAGGAAVIVLVVAAAAIAVAAAVGAGAGAVVGGRRQVDQVV